VGLITQAELETAISTARLQRISDKTNSAIDAALVAFAIEEASSTVLKYAQGTPGYPWTVTPTQAKTVCVEITVYYIYKELWGFCRQTCGAAMRTPSRSLTTWPKGRPLGSRGRPRRPLARARFFTLTASTDPVRVHLCVPGAGALSFCDQH